MTKQQGYFVYIFVTILFIISIWGGTLYFFYDDPERGTFGDMFGAANALFSGLAFAGLILAIFLQKEELESTKEELKGQKEQLKKQNETMTLQQFENTFFQMLRLHYDIVNGFIISKDEYEGSERGWIKQEFKGRHGVDKFFDRWRNCWHPSLLTPAPNNNLEGLPLLNDKYLPFSTQEGHPLSHYFRNFSSVIGFIDKSQIQDKAFYTNLVRAQLSNSELVLLFYHCFSDMGKEDLKPLVLKYDILKNLDKDTLFKPEEHWALLEKAKSEYKSQ
ncbi:MAG: hypothetical protein HN416_17320 [Nitrospina sp.]|jgi:hypothetical protein|nr:hypothetical protein [Nitrospina sp.]